MTRTNLVDAYSNRSVVAKLVNMEERISGAETSVEASAEAAASSASAAAASQTAAKTSETNAKASADTAAATLANTVDLSSKQTVTGAKTFAGDTTVTGSFVTSGNAEMAKLDIDTGKLTVGSGGSVEINGPLTASNISNVIKAANHDEALTSNDVLTAKDINEVNGKGNNLLHRSGNENVRGIKTFEVVMATPVNARITKANTAMELCRIAKTSDFVSTQLKVFACLFTRNGAFIGQILINIGSDGAITTGSKSGIGVTDPSSYIYAYYDNDYIVIALGNKDTNFNNFLSGETKGAMVGPGLKLAVDFTNAGTIVSPTDALKIDLTL